MKKKTKKCTKCNEIKEENKDNFLFRKDTGKHRVVCRTCMAARRRERRAIKMKDSEYSAKEKAKAKIQNKRFYGNNVEAMRLRSKKYMEENPEKVREANRAWHETNKEYRKEYKRNRRKIPHVVVSECVRNRIRMAVKYNNVKRIYRDLSFEEAVGCTQEELVSYLESMFIGGMSWGNYGYYGWHIDHIIPLSEYNLSKVDGIKGACHYTNLQPLWAKDNLSKSNRLNWRK